MLLRPYIKNHGVVVAVMAVVGKDESVVIECHSLQTVEQRMIERIGRLDKIGWVKSELR